YVNAPLSDTLSVRVAAEHRGLGDWQRSYTRTDSRGQRDFNNGRVSVLWKPSTQFRALLTASGWTDRGDVQATQLSFRLPSAPASVAAYPLAPADARAADWNAGTPFRRSNKYRQMSLRMDYDVSDAITVTSLTNYLKVNVDLFIDPDGTAITSTHNSQRGTSESFAQELRVAGKFDRLNVLGGVSYSNDITHDRLASIINVSSAQAGLGFNQLDGVTNQNVKNYAVFGNAEFKVTDQLTLQGGARYTQSNNDGTTCLGLDPGDGTVSAGLNAIQNFLRSLLTTPANPLPPLAAVGPGRCGAINLVTLTQQDTLLPLRLHEHNVSWRAGVQFEPSRATLLYANVSKGYKQGTLPLFGGIATDEAVPVSQESVIAYEAGFKQSFADRKIQLNGAVYYSDYKNKQVLGFIPVPVLGSSAGLVNIPKSRIWGAELQAVLRPTDGLILTAACSYTDAKISGNYTAPDALGVTRNFRGTVLPYAPKWQLSASARYEWPLHENLKGFLGANVAYQSLSYGNIGSDKILEIKPYSTTDLQLGA
ncbi:MAG: TonB-dependent receptor, partial [Novosphingobium sp.]